VTGYDPDERRLAERLTGRYPDWLVMWGSWSRQFWAYPLYRAPRGTIIHAATTGDLLTLMSRVELGVPSSEPRHPPQPPPDPHPGHPRGTTSP
jgi:hypothetical protein